MRRLTLPTAASVVVLAAAVATACTAPPARTSLTVHATERPRFDISVDLPPNAVDPMLTRQACTAAALSAVDSTRLFHNQMAVIERAAADDDTGTLIAAANRIQRSFVQLAQGLSTLSTKPLSPSVAEALREAAATVTEISSNTYGGSTADISARLADLTSSVLTACA
jgi:hypothetical protein